MSSILANRFFGINANYSNFVQLPHAASSFQRNYVEKDQFFRNQKETSLMQERRKEEAADKWINKSKSSSKVFEATLLAELMERRENGLIASSASDEYLQDYARKTAYDKAAALMVKNRIDNDALEFIQEKVKAVQHPKGPTFTRDGRDLRKLQRSKKRGENTGLVGAETFHSMYGNMDIDPPNQPAGDGFEDHSPCDVVVSDGNTTDRSTPSFITEATEPVQEPTALVEVRDEACYQSVMEETERAEALDELVRLLTGPQYDVQLMNANRVMAERKHSVNERLDGLVKIVERRMRQHSNTI